MIPVLAGLGALFLMSNPRKRRAKRRRNPRRYYKVQRSKKLPDKFIIQGPEGVVRGDDGLSRKFSSRKDAQESADSLNEQENERDNPNLGNTGLEFKQHAALRILQDKIEQHMGKQITLAQAKELIVAMERDLRMKSFRVIEGTGKRRANPIGLRAVDALVSLCKRKWGGQAAGWAADFANICRRGTPQKKLWAQVAQALKREMYAHNPRPKRRTR